LLVARFWLPVTGFHHEEYFLVTADEYFTGHLRFPDQLFGNQFLQIVGQGLH
jgi:hypothetical protein